MPVGALSVSCAQLTRDLLAIAKFLCWISITILILSRPTQGTTTSACNSFVVSVKLGHNRND